MEKVLKEYYMLMYRKFIDAELGRYNPDVFHSEKHRLQILMDSHGIESAVRIHTRNKAEKDAYKFLGK